MAAVDETEFDLDAAVCHCELAPLQELVREFEARHDVRVTRAPSVCLTMIRAEDSLESQPFYLGEALATECEVTVDGTSGYGICLSEEISRTYCMAVLDALRERGDETEAISAFTAAQCALLQDRDEREFAQVLRTRVDFKLLEQE